MAWIEFHETLRDHYKVGRLADTLEIPYPHALGLIACLWTWAVGNARDGDLSKFTEQEIGRACRFDGPAEKAVGALKSAGLLEGDMTLHDWKAHGTRLLDEARLRVQRSRFKDSTSKTSPQRGERGGKPLKSIVRERVGKKERKKEGKRVERYNREQKRNSNVSSNGKVQEMVSGLAHRMAAHPQKEGA